MGSFLGGAAYGKQAPRKFTDRQARKGVAVRWFWQASGKSTDQKPILGCRSVSF